MTSASNPPSSSMGFQFTAPIHVGGRLVLYIVGFPDNGKEVFSTKLSCMESPTMSNVLYTTKTTDVEFCTIIQGK